MQLLRRIVRGLCAYGFRAALFGFALFFALVGTLGSPSVIKDTLGESRLYDIPLTELARTEQSLQSDQQDLPINNPIVREAFDKAFPENRRQEAVESIIDGTYVWLRGEAPEPDFALDFTAERGIFIERLTSGAFERVNQLPACTPEQLVELREIDPLTISCKPPVDLNSERQRFANELTNNDKFLGDPRFNGEQLLSELRRNDTAGVVDTLPSMFQWFVRLPLLLAVAAIMTGLVIFFLADTKRKGAKKLGKLFIETVLSLTIVGVAVYVATGGIQASLSTRTSSLQLSEVLASTVIQLRNHIATSTIIVASVYLFAGVAILVLLHRSSWQKEASETDSKERQANDQFSSNNS